MSIWQHVVKNKRSHGAFDQYGKYWEKNTIVSFNTLTFRGYNIVQIWFPSLSLGSFAVIITESEVNDTSCALSSSVWTITSTYDQALEHR